LRLDGLQISGSERNGLLQNDVFKCVKRLCRGPHLLMFLFNLQLKNEFTFNAVGMSGCIVCV